MSWKEKLPLVGDKRLICVENNVIGNYFSERETTYAAVETIFEDPEIQIQCGRAFVEEAVNMLGRNAELRKAVRETVNQLEQQGKLSVTGAASLSPEQRAASQQLQRQLIRTFSAREAALLAEALARQVPLLTVETRICKGLSAMFEDNSFLNALQRHGLSQSLEITQPQPGASLISFG